MDGLPCIIVIDELEDKSKEELEEEETEFNLFNLKQIKKTAVLDTIKLKYHELEYSDLRRS